MPEVCLVLCTCPDNESALNIARKLVGEQLAACVNVIPALTSVYEWQDEVVVDQEVQLVIKTVKGKLGQAQRCVEQIHPYELPEWLVIDNLSGSDAYLNWIRSNLNEV